MARFQRHFIWIAFLLWAAAAPAQVRDEQHADSTSRVASDAPMAEAPDLAAAARRIVEQTNAFRQSEELPAVAANGSLDQAAQYFADFMARTDKYGHTADGQRPIDRAEEHDYEPCLVSENIAWQWSTRPLSSRELAAKFVEGWKESPEHRANLLDPDVTETGVAIAHSAESGHFYAVQMFGRPKSQAISIRITNRSDATVEYDVGDDQFSLPPSYIRTHERCRKTEVTMRLPVAGQDEPRKQTIAVADRAHFTVSRDDAGALQVEREQASDQN